jgi:hypothetical protein
METFLAEPVAKSSHGYTGEEAELVRPKSLTSAPGCPQKTELGSSSDCARAKSRTCRQTSVKSPEIKTVRADRGGR